MGNDEMNAEETKRAAQVMIAAADGKKIQFRFRNLIDGWHDLVFETAAWDWAVHEYRIKPEPLEGWVNVYPKATPEWRVGGVHETKASADMCAGSDRLRCVKMREVEE